ncbi:hypothetical protein SAMN02745117_01438 [Lampropedia hyalina DSM 16112]|jgi:hypothetical protein|uniref:Uncharacterized protein n=1 Tax=Lampropedia hyalina DSM 16112 TaxID=1122156 RepID=A0A1M4ZF62_9BURK|nr:hypothetical protein [Lampropedia hyalina]SHF16432.1 hypothetical protein SAMN02745117_01438 [Lampropedia hyalina DSM 16112]
MRADALTATIPAPTASTARLWLERGLYAIAVLALAAAFWLMVWLLRGTAPEPSSASSSQLAHLLPQWSQHPPAAARLQLDGQPDATQRAWLAALRQHGTAIHWQIHQNWQWQPLGLHVEPLADPHQPVRIWATTPADATQATLHEQTGTAPNPIVSLSANAAGATVLNHGRLAGAVVLQHGAQQASAVLQDALKLRPVLLLGQASWEARFVASALEEHGWRIDARLQLAPTQIVGQTPPPRPQRNAEHSARGGRGGRGGGGPGGGRSGSGPGGPTAASGPDSAAPEAAAAEPVIGPPDISTAHYAAVVVLDETSAAPHAAALHAYVRAGGGLLVLGHANRSSALQGLLPATALGEVQEARSFPPASDALAEAAETEAHASATPREHLELLPLQPLQTQAHVLEQRGDAIAVALHRLEQGRVLQIGYADTWRWPIAVRDEHAPQAHRQWLASLLTLVAHAPRSDQPPTLEQLARHDPAPLAAWHAALGHSARTAMPSTPVAAASAASTPSPHWLAWLFALAALSLLLQWLSRRLRSAS